MSFTSMRDKLIKHFAEMTQDATHLFEVDLNKDELWELYLSSFPEGTNETFRERTEHDCSCCRHFIRSIGNVVCIKDNKVTTIWDFDTESTTYQPVVDALSKFVKQHRVSDVFVTNFNKFGSLQNFEELQDGKVLTWTHFFLELPSKFLHRGSASVGEMRGQYNSIREAFKNSLDSISVDAIDTILELIHSNTLYKGEEWKYALTEFRKFKQMYDTLETEEEKHNFTWVQSTVVNGIVGKIKGHSIGVLLVDVSNGVDLDLAVRKYENIVAPANYKRPKEIFTKKMLEDAKKTIENLGYMDSLPRCHATLDDISANNILFSNKDSAKRIAGVDSIFDDLEKETVSTSKKFSRVDEIQVDKFISDVLPTARELELYLENRHASNMVSLIAPVNKDAKSMFKWDNSFSWAYTGNITDSMKERVKSLGGKVDGVLRFSIQWNEDGDDNYDLDAHCVEPNGNEISFRNHRKPSVSKLSGQLDVDIIDPSGKVAVENITWSNKSKMEAGVYRFFVHQYSGSVRKGFRAEIEFNGQIYSFNYNRAMRTGEKVQVAEVTLNRDGTFTIKERIPSSLASREVWGINTNQFIPVSVMMYSPNYWNEQTGNGHRHIFFMLKDCVNPEELNGFYNEFLRNELLEQKRVLSALGSKMRVPFTEDQLSGVGFSTTKRDDVTVRVKGSTERIFKIKF